MSSTQCSSPTVSVKGPFSRCRKRPPSPEVTTGSLSTFASAGKKTCSTFSALSDSKQPRTTLLNYFPYSKQGVFPAYTALTSAVTEADDDDLDEAVSSFRAPPGHIPHHDAMPQHVLSTQPFSSLPLHPHHSTTSPFCSNAPPAGPISTGGNHSLLPATDRPVFGNSSVPGSSSARCPSGSRCTSTSSRPATGVLSKGEEQEASFVSPDEARHAVGFVLRRRSLPSASGQDIEILQIQGPSQVMTAGDAGDCHTFCHPTERALYQMVPQDPQYHVYSPESLASDLDIEP
ncbi:hypothetical protein ABBQ32_013386 [Trebouxia sp. C0010 RCD-2024]